MANRVVKVRRETIASCMTCSICNKLLRDATTISECLHTFCRKCIYEKVSDEGLYSCPKCNIYLGCVPLEKLRPDHNLQDMRAKIFPFKRRKVEAPEVALSLMLPVRRKERSLSSLVVSTPKISTKTTKIGRRKIPAPRKAASLRGSSFSTEKPVKKEDDLAEEHLGSSSSPETPNKFSHNKWQNSSSAEPAQPASTDEANKSAETWEEISDLWKPLHCLVEVANRTKSFKSNSQVSDTKLESSHVPDNEPQACKTKFKKRKNKSKVEDKKNNTNTLSSERVEQKKLNRFHQRKATAFGNSGVSSQDVLDAGGAKQERRNGPVWFSLVASDDQDGDALLPQIPASYLRIKDGNMPVSFIQKYLLQKLNLPSEAEVEIKCMGQPVVPTLLLYDLFDMWLHAASTSERVPASIGSSAKDFVMELAYARRVPGPQ